MVVEQRYEIYKTDLSGKIRDYLPLEQMELMRIICQIGIADLVRHNLWSRQVQRRVGLLYWLVSSFFEVNCHIMVDGMLYYWSDSIYF